MYNSTCVYHILNWIERTGNKYLTKLFTGKVTQNNKYYRTLGTSKIVCKITGHRSLANLSDRLVSQ